MTSLFEIGALLVGVVVLIILYRIAQDVEAIKEHLTARDDNAEEDDV